MDARGALCSAAALLLPAGYRYGWALGPHTIGIGDAFNGQQQRDDEAARRCHSSRSRWCIGFAWLCIASTQGA